MLLDNELIIPSNTVYDLYYGYGVVTMVTPTEISAEFTDISGVKRSCNYVGNGFRQGRKRLFWKDPIIIIPPKDSDKWEHNKIKVLKIIDLLK